MDRPAVFLDRDGVIIPDEGLLLGSARPRLFDGVANALSRLRDGGYELIVVTNQPVIARGLAAECDVIAVHDAIRDDIAAAGGPPITEFYFCPHHPNANLELYRAECECRKPKPGLLLLAARQHGLDLASSYMIGDRISDIAAGAAAGCRTVLVRTGRHSDPPIETSVPLPPSLGADFSCNDLSAAADWILGETRRGSRRLVRPLL